MPRREVGYTGFDSRIEWPSPEIATLVALLSVRKQHQPRPRALDLGCGNGTESLFLAMQGWEVVAIDPSQEAIHEVRERVGQLPQRARGRVKALKRSAAGFREEAPGGFALVLDRLVYQNMFRWVSVGYKATARTYGERRRGLLRTAAYALRSDGLFVVRMLPGNATRWGTVQSSRLGRDDRKLLTKYFSLSREIAYTGLVTDPLQTDGALVVAPKQMSILIATRNAVPFSDENRPRRRTPRARAAAPAGRGKRG